jgi:ABC-type bacteriocin/lantibiotic exporter with double-glycine peptidase domain
MCRYSWQLTLVILSVTPVILIVMFLQGTCMKVLTEQELSALAGAGANSLIGCPTSLTRRHALEHCV